MYPMLGRYLPLFAVEQDAEFLPPLAGGFCRRNDSHFHRNLRDQRLTLAEEIFDLRQFPLTDCPDILEQVKGFPLEYHGIQVFVHTHAPLEALLPWYQNDFLMSIAFQDRLRYNVLKHTGCVHHESLAGFSRTCRMG